MIEKLEQWVNLEELMTTVVAFLPRLGMAIVIFVAFSLAYRLSRKPLSAILRKADLDETLVKLLVTKLYRYTLLIIGLVMGLDQLGVDVTAALAGIGVIGLALGFAAQDSVANVISGILIFWDKPFVVGDWIKTEGEYGKVSNITLRTTRIRTTRNTYVVLPNKRIIDELLENYSKHGELRVDVPIGIGYGEDIEKARQVLLEAARSVDGRCEDREPEVVVANLGGSSVDLKIRVWIEDADDQRKVWFTTTERAKVALDEAGIEIPFPHMQLYVDGVKEPVWEGAKSLVS